MEKCFSISIHCITDFLYILGMHVILYAYICIKASNENNVERLEIGLGTSLLINSEGLISLNWY